MAFDDTGFLSHWFYKLVDGIVEMKKSKSEKMVAGLGDAKKL